MLSIKKYSEHFNKVIWLFGQSKKYLVLLIICFVISGLIDLVGIGLIGPFVAIFIDFNKTTETIPFLANYSYENVAIVSSLILISIFVIRIITAYLVNNFVLSIVFNRQVELRSMLINAIHDQSYLERLNKTTGHYTSAIISFCTEYTSTAISMLRASAEIISVMFIIILLVITDWKLFFLTLGLAGSVLFVAITYFSKTFSNFGAIKNEGRRQFTDAVNDSVNGLKEIKILKISDFFKNKVIEGAKITAQAEKKLYLYTIVPRYFIECLLVFIICGMLLFSILLNGSILETISSLTVFLVASVRLLPSLNAIFQNFNIINLEMDSVNKLFLELTEFRDEFSNTKSHSINKENFYYKNFKTLEINNLNFSYGEKLIFNNLNLTISKGDFIGLLGKSGEGKTTFVDLILGIHSPHGGTIQVNKKSIFDDISSWRDNLAYLPQETFLINTTIAENIAIGETIDETVENKILYSIKKAGLEHVIMSLDDGIYTTIGERGLMLSGGQRQRVSLARAFYKNRNFFIFDESTSALDAESAERILDHIYNMSLEGSTIILISHNESALRKCNRKIRISNGEIIEEL